MTERDGPDGERPEQPRATEQGAGPENPLGAWDGRGLDGVAKRAPHGAPEEGGGAGAHGLPSERTGGVAQGWLVYLLLSFVRMLLVTLGMIALVPQGLVPLGMAVFEADESTRLWFLARFMPPEWQVPVALGFAVVGALLTWIGLLLPRWLGWVFMGR
ncbi:hypothetical protein [Nocardiopsis oceani]